MTFFFCIQNSVHEIVQKQAPRGLGWVLSVTLEWLYLSWLHKALNAHLRNGNKARAPANCPWCRRLDLRLPASSRVGGKAFLLW